MLLRLLVGQLSEGHGPNFHREAKFCVGVYSTSNRVQSLRPTRLGFIVFTRTSVRRQLVGVFTFCLFYELLSYHHLFFFIPSPPAPVTKRVLPGNVGGSRRIRGRPLLNRVAGDSPSVLILKNSVVFVPLLEGFLFGVLAIDFGLRYSRNVCSF